MWHKYKPWGDDVSCTISRSIGERSRSQGSLEFCSRGGVILVDHWSTISCCFNSICLHPWCLATEYRRVRYWLTSPIFGDSLGGLNYVSWDLGVADQSISLAFWSIGYCSNIVFRSSYSSRWTLLAFPARNLMLYSTTKYSASTKHLLNASSWNRGIPSCHKDTKLYMNAVFGVRIGDLVQMCPYLCRCRWCRGSTIWIIRMYRYVACPSKNKRYDHNCWSLIITFVYGWLGRSFDITITSPPRYLFTGIVFRTQIEYVLYDPKMLRYVD